MVDLSQLLTAEEKDYYKKKIEEELDKQEASLLIQKSMNSSQKDYETIVRSWRIFADKLTC